MSFRENGYLEPGFHDWTIEQAKDVLVDRFPESDSRPPIMGGYERFRAIFRSLGVPCEHWLDGSYCSNKLNPGDIDIVVVADLHEVDKLSRIGQQLWQSLVRGPETKAAYRCDSYFLPSVPADHPWAQFCEERRGYWIKQFGTDRQGIEKGIAKLTLGRESVLGASK